MRPRLSRSRTLVATAFVALATLLLPALAHADDFQPGPGAAGPASLVGFVESPLGGQLIIPTGSFSVSGWVVDQTAQGWSGVDSAEVWDGPIGQGGTQLGQGSALLSRPDVATFFGNGFWTRSGFNVPVGADQLGFGPKTLYLYAVTPGRGRWFLTLVVVARIDGPSPSDAFPDDPLIRVFDPLPSALLRTSPDVLRGIAFDRNAPPSAGTGIDRVDIYVGPREAGGTFVAAAELGKRYGDAGREFNDGRFDTAGWDAIWNPRSYGRGEFDLYVYARRAGTTVWNVVRVRVTIAP